MEKIIEPTVCPFCGAPVIRQVNNDSNAGTNIYCSNEECPERKIAKLNFFVSKEGMDIEGLSDKTIRKLVASNYIENWWDLYRLQYMDFIACGLGEKVSLNLCEAIEKSRKSVPAEQVLCALGIPMLGPATAKLLLEEYKDIKKLANAKSFELELIEGIGDVAAQKIASYFHSHTEEMSYVCDYLKTELGPGNITQVSDRLSGMTILATGALKNFSREGIIESVESNGGKYASGVSKKLTFLIVGNDAGPAKIAKAKELGLKMIKEEDYIKIINGENEEREEEPARGALF